MIELKTTVFVDGWNFHNNLQHFRFQPDPDHRPYRLDEKHFMWQKFFPEVLNFFNRENLAFQLRLIRVYLYSAQTIVPFQENVKAAEEIANSHKGQIPDLTAQKVVELAKEWYEHERRNFYALKEQVYENIQRRTDFLEFKGIGKYVVKPFLKPENKTKLQLEKRDDDSLIYRGRRIGEKGVDIGMAVDMVSKMNNYDVAIVISGDADFLPVIQYLKDQLKQVFQFSIAEGVPPQIRYLSPWLKSVCDKFGFFDEVELLTKFLYRKPIPKVILSAIDQRVGELKKLKSSKR